MSLIEKQKMKEIKLKNQPKWLTRTFILLGAILGGVFAFILHPIGGTSAQSVDCPDGQHLATGNVCVTNDLDIVIQATATEDGQTLQINKYFANAYTVDWGDGNPVENLTADTIHTYENEGIYNIILSLTGGATRWIFTCNGDSHNNKPLVSFKVNSIVKSTVTGVKIIYMPSLAEGFGNSKTAPGTCFFAYFNGGYNNVGALTSFPEGSFDTSNITTVGDYFFYRFNGDNGAGELTSLPEGSFDISNITTVGDYFFASFLRYNGKKISLPEGSFRFSTGLTTVGNYFFRSFGGALTSLPEGSFNLSNITSVGNDFFSYFNYNGALTSLPAGSFDTSHITTVGNNFFSYFNSNEGQLISLPEGSFRLSTGLTTVGNEFFSNFNGYYGVRGELGGKLTSLPEGSFDTSHITTVGNNFFSYFNSNKGQLTSLPEGSFDTSNITTVGDGFFNWFNANEGQLISLPEGSFRLSTGLTTVGNEFFSNFNGSISNSYVGGMLTSLPEGSFDTSNITTVGNSFFSYFNSDNGQLTSLPEGSFDTSNITTVGNSFFSYFNSNKGQLTSLPEGSFDTSNITTVGNSFFSYFNSDNGQLTSLPEGSFDTSNITTVGNSFFSYFNSNKGQLTSLPEGSFDISNITTIGDNFFMEFNSDKGQLTSLPGGSFRLSTQLTTVGNNFFRAFNYSGKIMTLPGGSFNTENIATVGNYFFRSFNGEGVLTSLPEGSFDTSNITTVGDYFFSNFNYIGGLESLPEGSFDATSITTVGNYFFDGFNINGALTILPDSFRLISAAYDKTGGYQNAFNSPNYTLNKNVSDLVSGVVAPADDRNTFSDNQPGRCGVDINWLVSISDACHIRYDANGGVGSATGGYAANSTSVVAGLNISIPIRNGYVFNGWYTDPEGGELVENVVFPSMNGDTLYAHWEIGQTVTFDANGGTTSQTTQTVSENTSINLPNASLDGYEFLGWYTEEMGGTRVGGYNDPYTVSQDIILYAHWIEALPEGIFFQTGDITYTDTNGKVFTGIGTITIRSGGETITILDRNLGATTNDISDTGSHGYYFQWGNNYGFNLDEDFSISSTAIEATGYSWNNPYVSGNFVAANYRDRSYNPELRGGADDYDNSRGIDTSDDGYTRQGPCPAGYHVPSIGEFDELMRITKSITGGTVQLQTNSNGNLVESNPFAAAFMSELHFPIAGYIGWDGVYTGILEEGYSYSHFWSSSFKKANGYLMINHHPTASKKDKVSTRGNNMQQGNAFSIRCFKDTADDGEEIVLSYETRNGSAIQAQALPVGGTGYLPGYSTHREDAELLGWYEEDLLTPVDLENKILDEDTMIYARWSDDYIVKFLDFDDTILKTEVVRSGDSVIAPVNPVRDGYTFKGWDLDFGNVTGDMVITAQYTKNQSISNGGGGGNSLKRDNCPDGDYSDSYYDGTCGKKPIQKDDEKDSSTKPQNNKTGHNSAKNEVVYDTLRFNPHYSDEMNQAYQFAYHYGITTKTNIKDAAMNWELTRIAMAKMLSQYAINVLGIKPDTTRNNDFTDVSDKLDSEYDDGVTLAYQLGIMGINMPNNEFKPYNYVTRAEFATAFSRLLYNTPDGMFEGTSRYYTPHISKLAYEGILTNTNPYMKELRGYVMLMLMRSAK